MSASLVGGRFGCAAESARAWGESVFSSALESASIWGKAAPGLPKPCLPVQV